MSGIFEVTELVAATGGEPRMSAALLAERLGMANRQTMMRLIERNMKSVLRFGEYLATVAKNPSENGGRPSKDFLLNEGQAVYIASKSGTPLADEVHIGLVQVFLEWRHGGKSQATVAKNPDPELDAKRAYYAALPEVHRGRADLRAEALAQVEDLIAEGMRVSHAIAAVAEEKGLGVRSLYSYRRAVYMVPQRDWQAAMAPRWNGPRAMLAECHPEALMMMFRLVASGGRYSESHARVVDEAAVQGWAPVAHIRTMSRAVQRMVPRLPHSPKQKKEAGHQDPLGDPRSRSGQADRADVSGFCR